ncbi:hypothetical protein SH2C18_39150 [Clostridium sediminicola]|uniref:ATP cone domain-containing protein n=1 Tax=Clostridium sediminicola TaxID=3114879 RepID=UPI0031F1FA04
MKVIKRNGSIQNFNKNKIKSAIRGASDDSKECFNVSDIKNITVCILKAIGDKEIIKSSEIGEIIVRVLKDFGFKKTAKLFEE